MHQDDAIFALRKNVQHNTTQSINCPSVIRCMQLVNALFLKFLPTHVWLKDAAEILNSKDTFLLFLLQTNTSTSAGSSVTQISSKTYKSISHSAVVNFRSTGCFFGHSWQSVTVSQLTENYARPRTDSLAIVEPSDAQPEFWRLYLLNYNVF